MQHRSHCLQHVPINLHQWPAPLAVMILTCTNLPEYTLWTKPKPISILGAQIHDKLEPEPCRVHISWHEHALVWLRGRTNGYTAHTTG